MASNILGTGKTPTSQVPSIYGDHLPQMEAVLGRLVGRVGTLRESMTQELGLDPIEHVLARIKSEESMRDKLSRKGLPQTTEAALTQVYDAIGVRIVCGFLSDVYAMRNHLAADTELEVVEERDYIRFAKPNGYRSYHMILRSRQGYYAEVQLRTISMDTWAALEHHLQYKKAHAGNQRLMVQELKRCADELASTDVTMQTIRDAIFAADADAPAQPEPATPAAVPLLVPTYATSVLAPGATLGPPAPEPVASQPTTPAPAAHDLSIPNVQEAMSS